MSSFEYQNSTISKYRAGTIDDPYIDITESKKVINNTIQLNEVPAFLNKVQIDNYVEIPNMSLDELEKMSTGWIIRKPLSIFIQLQKVKC